MQIRFINDLFNAESARRLLLIPFSTYFTGKTKGFLQQLKTTLLFCIRYENDFSCSIEGTFFNPTDLPKSDETHSTLVWEVPVLEWSGFGPWPGPCRVLSPNAFLKIPDEYTKHRILNYEILTIKSEMYSTVYDLGNLLAWGFFDTNSLLFRTKSWKQICIWQKYAIFLSNLRSNSPDNRTCNTS